MKLQTGRTAAFVVAQITVVACLFVCLLPIPTQSQSPKQVLIIQPIDEQKLVTLAGSTRPEIQAAKDLGAVPDNLLLAHMYLQLKRAPGQDEAVKNLIDQMHDPKASRYHQWLTADKIAERFGPSEQDVQTISGWLESHGFSVNVVYPQNGVIDFSGPASSMREAFHTEIHQFNVNGEMHIANVSDPQIPAALVPAMLGIVSMSDFRPKRALIPRAQYTIPGPGIPGYPVVPGDLHTIYNFNPLYKAGITGEGQTIVVLEPSDVYNPQDWTTFRDTFGLSKEFPQGSFRQIHPQPTSAPNNGGPCVDPGIDAYGDDIEAILDAEWASASAPNAAVVVAACADTNTNYGWLIALQNLLTGNGQPPGIVSMSYAFAETANQTPPPFQPYITQLYQLAVLQGVSIFVAAGDDGGAMVDYHAPTALNGITVNGFASTQYDVAVGGNRLCRLLPRRNLAILEPDEREVLQFSVVLRPRNPVERLLCESADREFLRVQHYVRQRRVL
jgi:subtilase family serine protease